MTPDERQLTKPSFASWLHLFLIFSSARESAAPAGHDWLFDWGSGLALEGGSYKRSAALLHVPAPRRPCANTWSRWQQTTPQMQPQSQLTGCQPAPIIAADIWAHIWSPVIPVGSRASIHRAPSIHYLVTVKHFWGRNVDDGFVEVVR